MKTWSETAASSAAAALDAIGPDGIIEAHSALGVQPAQDAMAHALGVPREDGMPYVRATNITQYALGQSPAEHEITRAHEAFGYMLFQTENLIREKRADRGDGLLLDHMLDAVESGELSERELKESVSILWGSASHNPGQVMASSLVDFAEHPDIFHAYKTDESVREAIINESIRRAIPETALDRFTTEPLEIRGVTIPANAPIRFLLAAALRDPDVFPNPDDFDYNRPKEASMALVFGAGTHNCAGQNLARAEARAVLDEIASRYERIEIIGEPVWHRSDRHRNCEGLTVRLS